MTKLALKRTGPDDPWVIQPPNDAAYVYINKGLTIEIEWNDTTTQPLAGEALVWGAGNRPDLTLGMLYIIFVIQSDSQVWCTTIDNVDLDVLLGSATWGIVAWLDIDGAHDWQQF